MSSDGGGGGERHSVTNSKMSRRQRHGELSSNRVSAFQTLNGWDEHLRRNPPSQLVTAASMVAVQVQVLALVFSPAFEFRAEVVRQLSFAAAAALVPLWDPAFGGGVALEFFMIVMGALLLAAVLFWAVFFGYTSKSIEQRHGSLLDQLVRGIGLSLASGLAMPTAHVFAAPMACAASESVASFPATPCGSALHVAAIVIGAVGLAVSASAGLLIATTLGDRDPTSKHIAASAHTYCAATTHVVLQLLVVLRHVFVPLGQRGLYSCIVAALLAALLAMEAFVLPWYHVGVTRWRCAGYAVAILAACVNIAAAFADAWFVDGDVNSLLFFALAPLAAIVGGALGTARVSPEFCHRFTALHQLALVHKHSGRFPFPRGLAANDLRYVKRRLRTLETDIVVELEDMQSTEGMDAEAAWERQISACSEILVPAIERVTIATDSEVAVRYLARHAEITSLDPTGHLLAFATRIYTKSLYLFRRAGIVKFAFANFLFRYASKLNIAMELLEEVEYEVGAAHDGVLLYAAYKLGVRVREIFGLRDSSLMHTFMRAKQLHRESLSLMAAFWTKLLDSRSDLVGLANIANNITERRREARLEYARALADRTDRLILTLYASFLENVLLNPQKAQEFRELAEEIAEAKKNSMLRGYKKKNNLAAMTANAALLTNVDADSADSDSPGRTDGERSGGGLPVGTLTGSRTHMRAIVFLLGIVIVLSAASFGTQVARSSSLERDVTQVAVASSAAASAEQISASALRARRLFELNCDDATAAAAAAGSASASMGACDNAAFLDAVGATLSEDIAMRAQHNEFTHVPRRAPGAAVQTFLTTRSVMLPFTEERANNRMPSSNRPDSRPGDGTTPVGFTSPVGEYAPGRWRMVRAVSPWMMVHRLSTLAAHLVNTMLDGSGDGGGSSIAFAMAGIDDMTANSLVAETVQQAMDVIQSEANTSSNAFFEVSLALFVIAIVFLVATYAVFEGHVRTVAISKVATLSLFSLIPFPTQELLQSAAKGKVDHFEHLHADDDGDDDDDRARNTGGDEDDEDDHGHTDADLLAGHSRGVGSNGGGGGGGRVSPPLSRHALPSPRANNDGVAPGGGNDPLGETKNRSLSGGGGAAERRKASMDEARKRSSANSGKFSAVARTVMALGALHHSISPNASSHAAPGGVGGGERSGTRNSVSPALSTSLQAAGADFADDSARKMSRFLGVRPTLPGTSAAQRSSHHLPPRSILKKPRAAAGGDGAAAASHKRVNVDQTSGGGGGSGQQRPRATFVKRVKFQLEDDGGKPHRKLREPTIALDVDEGELIADLTQSMRQAEDDERAHAERQRQRHQQEVERLIDGGLHGRLVSSARRRGGGSGAGAAAGGGALGGALREQRKHGKGSGRRGQLQRTRSGSGAGRADGANGGDNAAASDDANADYVSDSDSDSDERVASRIFTATNVAIALVTLGLVAGVVVCSVGHALITTHVAQAEGIVEREKLLHDIRAHQQAVRTHALTLGQFARLESYQALALLLRESPHTGVLRRLGYAPHEITEQLSREIEDIAAIVDRCIGGDLTGAAFALRAQQARLPLRDAPLLASLIWGTTRLSYSELSHYPDALENRDEYFFPSMRDLQQVERDAPQNVTPGLLQQIGLRRLHSERARADEQVFDRELREAVAATHEEFQATFGVRRGRIIDMAAAAIAALSIVIMAALLKLRGFVLAHAAGLRSVPIGEWRGLLGAAEIVDALCHALVLVLAVAGLVFATDIIRFLEVAEGAQQVRLYSELAAEHADIAARVSRRRVLVSKYTVAPTDLLAFQITEELGDIPERLVALFEQSTDPAGAGLTLAGMTAAGVVAPLLTHQRVQHISMLLSFVATNDKRLPTAADGEFIRSYDFDSEPGAAQDRVRYEQDLPELQYSSAARDIATRSAGELAEMARFAVFGQRGIDMMRAVDEVVARLGSVLVAEATRETSNYFVGIRRSQLLALVCSGISMGLYALMYGMPFTLRLLASGGTATEAAKKNTDTMIEALYSRTLRKVKLSLLALALLLAVQFTLIALTTEVGDEAIGLVRDAVGRERWVARAIAVTERLSLALGDENLMRVSALQRDAQRTAIELTAARERLYRSPVSSSRRFGRALSLTNRQREIIFGGDDPLDRRYLRLINHLNTLAVTEATLSTTVGGGGGAVAVARNASGPDQTVGALPITGTVPISDSTHEQLNAVMAEVVRAAESIAAELKQSSEVHVEDAKSSLRALLAPNVILFVAIALCAAAEFYGVVRPIARAAAIEDQGTRLMLRLIPPGVRDMVPKIQLFLESGMLVDEQVEKRAYSRSSAVEAFIKKWQVGLPEQQCYATLKQHTSGVIVIDAQGIVTYINEQVTALLGYSSEDMVKQNVKMIVDEPLRSLHDGFLRRFIETGNSRIVGTGRDVLALSKSGAHVHVFLHLAEAVRHTGDIFFVGEIRPYDWAVATGASRKMRTEAVEGRSD